MPFDLTILVYLLLTNVSQSCSMISELSITLLIETDLFLASSLSSSKLNKWALLFELISPSSSILSASFET